MKESNSAINWFRSAGPVVEMPKEKIRRVALWDVTNKCDLRCVHCYNYDKYMAKNASIKNETSTTEALTIIDKLADFGFNQIHFLGGEPLNRPDCLDLFSYAISRGIKVTINTNGIRLTADIIKQLIDRGVSQVAVSLDGSDAISNDRIRGNGTFQRITTNLEKFSELITKNNSNILLGIISTLTYPLLQEPEKVGGYFSLADKLGINWLNFIFLYKNSKALSEANSLAYPMGMALDVIEKEVVKGKREYPEIYVQLDCRPLFGKYLNRKYGIITHIYHWAIKCSAGNHTWLIDADGQAHPCGICTSPEYGLAASEAGCFIYEPKNLVEVENCQEVYESRYFKSVRNYLYDKNNYKKFHICNDCEYFGDVCLPCPLYSTEGPAFKLDSCGVEECKWVISKLDSFYAEKQNVVPKMKINGIEKRPDKNGKSKLFLSDGSLHFKVTGSGDYLWGLIDNTTSINEMVEKISLTFTNCPDKNVLLRDVVDYLCNLRDGNIITLD